MKQNTQYSRCTGLSSSTCSDCVTGATDCGEFPPDDPASGDCEVDGLCEGAVVPDTTTETDDASECQQVP